MMYMHIMYPNCLICIVHYILICAIIIMILIHLWLSRLLLHPCIHNHRGLSHEKDTQTVNSVKVSSQSLD